MYSYAVSLEIKTLKLIRKYKGKNICIALKLICWNLAVIFRALVNAMFFRDSTETFYRLYTETGRPIANKCPPNMVPPIPPRGSICIDIDKALELNPRIKKIALIFFMGIGDYFLSTNFIEMLKARYPKISLQALVSKNVDSNNSPIVGKAIEKNPHFDKICYFDGHSDYNDWRNYDYRDCSSQIDDETLLLPLICHHHEAVTSRTSTICETFCFPSPNIAMPPIVYTDYEASENVKQIFDQAMQKLSSGQCKRLAFLQVSSRSSQYTYPHVDELISLLLAQEYCVICVDKHHIVSENCINIDVATFDINESIKLVSMLRQHGIILITVVSCFWAISSGLNIPNLGMQHWDDRCIASVWHPNIYVIAHDSYKYLPKSRTFLAGQNDFTQNSYGDSKHDGFYNYKAKFVIECLLKMLEIEKLTSR
ncbi:MAG: hypothetical protein LBI56_03485 [Puniceicoccales bacterium]|jgi:hypothetical protein|nr:hypothetical protein [Puniceicoccales bacterium]